MRFAGDDRPEIEYQWPEDDAWYGVGLLLIDDVLVVRYEGFSSDVDEVFPAADSFACSEELGRFRARFRPASVQLQDSQCRTVKEGTEVCASHHFENGDVKFFDAVVVEVQNAEHNHDADGMETCSCIYSLLWRQGPLVGKITPAKMDSICVSPKDKRIDPTLVSFLKKASKHIVKAPDNAPETSNKNDEPKHRLSFPNECKPVSTKINQPSSFDGSPLTTEPSCNRHDEPVFSLYARIKGVSEPPLPPRNGRELMGETFSSKICDSRVKLSSCKTGSLMTNNFPYQHGGLGLNPTPPDGSSTPMPKLSSHRGGVVMHEPCEIRDSALILKSSLLEDLTVMPKPSGPSPVMSKEIKLTDALNIGLDFYSKQRARRRGRFAVRMTKGRLHGLRKKH